MYVLAGSLFSVDGAGFETRLKLLFILTVSIRSKRFAGCGATVV